MRSPIRRVCLLRESRRGGDLISKARSCHCFGSVPILCVSIQQTRENWPVALSISDGQSHQPAPPAGAFRLMNGYLSKLALYARSIAGQPRLPLILGLAAVIVMLPALGAGLMLDDLVQRSMQFTPAELPSRLLDTGFISDDSGRLRTVLSDLFGFPRGEAAAARARDYGLLAWWMPEGLKAALWRPLTAFTHWLDYRLFPNTPALMHAQNILWFAIAVFLTAAVYREIGTCSPGQAPAENRPGLSCVNQDSWNIWAGSLAACLFLLDANTYFPVMFVANRGFIISLVFGLLCLRAHHRWRTTGSKIQMALSAFCLLLSLLANEGGASTLCFLIAYALVLEPMAHVSAASEPGLSTWRTWRARWFLSLLPAAVVVLGWRAAYVSSGFGVRMIGGYIDPGYEPWLYLKNLVPRMNALLGGQLTGLPPEISVPLAPQSQAALTVLFAGFNLLCAAVFFPMLRRDRRTRFWAAAMLLALVPAATVAPLTKNMAFIAVGAFALLGSFLVRFANREYRLRMSRPLRLTAWSVAVWVIIAHVPGPVLGRIAMAQANRFIPKVMARWCGFCDGPEIGERDVVILNNPSQLSTIAAPFYRAYHGESVPRTMRTLVPGSIPVQVTRPDGSTLILRTKEADLFSCPGLGAIHLCYAFKSINDFLAGGKARKKGDRVARKGLLAEVLDVSPQGIPRAVAFHFDRPLESYVWLFFDWHRRRYSPLALPNPGEALEIAGAGR